MAQTIHVTVKDKFGVTAEDDYTAVTSYNEVGEFDVLPLHTNFISLIKTKLILRKGPTQKEIKVGTGLMEVEDDKVSVFLGLPEANANSNPLPAPIPIKK